MLNILFNNICLLCGNCGRDACKQLKFEINFTKLIKMSGPTLRERGDVRDRIWSEYYNYSVVFAVSDDEREVNIVDVKHNHTILQ